MIDWWNFCLFGPCMYAGNVRCAGNPFPFCHKGCINMSCMVLRCLGLTCLLVWVRYADTLFPFAIRVVSMCWYIEMSGPCMSAGLVRYAGTLFSLCHKGCIDVLMYWDVWALHACQSCEVCQLPFSLFAIRVVSMCWGTADVLLSCRQWVWKSSLQDCTWTSLPLPQGCI